MTKEKTLYNLVWLVNGKVKETLITNKPKALCKWEKLKRENSTHKTGLLMVVKAK